jgi:hypothetical protein
LKYKSGDKKTTPIRTEEIELDENNNINLINSIITFEDINKNDDLIAVYLEHKKDEKDNFKKVEIKNGKKKYHLIRLRDIKINEPSKLSFHIVDNISLTINIKIIKSFGHRQGKSFYMKMSAFNTNQKMEEIIKNNISKAKLDKPTQKKVDIQSEKIKKDENNNNDKNNNKIEKEKR